MKILLGLLMNGKNTILIFLLILSFQVNAQILDSISLSTEYEYKSLDEALKNPEKVYKLTLKRKRLDEIPKEIFTLTNLQELNLKKNKIKKIPKEIGSLRNLQKLNLSQNKLIFLPKEIGMLINLNELILNRNVIEILPPEIGNLTKLRYLDLWSNEIYYFPDEIKKLQNTLKIVDLRVIRMSYNSQDKIAEQLPNTKIFFTKGCNCMD